jgi:hypothetical protein
LARRVVSFVCHAHTPSASAVDRAVQKHTTAANPAFLLRAPAPPPPPPAAAAAAAVCNAAAMSDKRMRPIVKLEPGDGDAKEQQAAAAATGGSRQRRRGDVGEEGAGAELQLQLLSANAEAQVFALQGVEREREQLLNRRVIFIATGIVESLFDGRLRQCLSGSHFTFRARSTAAPLAGCARGCLPAVQRSGTWGGGQLLPSAAVEGEELSMPLATCSAR